MRPVASDEKSVMVMVYTQNTLVRGQLIAPEGVHVSLWLRNQDISNYMHLINPEMLMFGSSAPSMATITALAGTFLIKAKIWVSSQTDLGASLDVIRTPWLSLYEAHISNPYMTQFNLLVPMLLVSSNAVSFGV